MEEKKEKWREKLEQFKQDDRYDYLVELLLPYTAGFRAGSLDRGFLPILCEVEELLDKAREEGMFDRFELSYIKTLHSEARAYRKYMGVTLTEDGEKRDKDFISKLSKLTTK